jgi:hypothetical protein
VFPPQLAPVVAAVRRRPVLAALLLATGARVAVFVLACIVPLTNESGSLVSPLLPQNGVDFFFYRDSWTLYRDLSWGELYGMFAEFYDRPFAEQRGNMIAGPVYPLIIAASGYTDDNTLPLALLFLAMSIATVWMWLAWLGGRGLGIWALCVFALLPNPLWFMLNLSSDLVFALLIAVFYVVYCRGTQTLPSTAAWVLLLVAIVLTRPNGYSVMLFVMLDLLLRFSGRRRAMVLAATSLLALAFALYLYPYFIVQMKATGQVTFFGIPQGEFYDGIFGLLPQALDLVLSWLALLGAKAMYFVGLRPSYGGMEWHWVALRSAAAIVFLPGLLYLLVAGDRTDRLFVFTFALPILMAQTQDRYNLPIQGILFYYGVLALGLPWRQWGANAAAAQRLALPREPRQ